MPSAFILAVRSYPALLQAEQLAHQRYVPPNPLVLGRKLRKSPAPATDRDRPVSRRSKPSSTLIHDYSWCRLYLHPDGSVRGPASDSTLNPPRSCLDESRYLTRHPREWG